MSVVAPQAKPRGLLLTPGVHSPCEGECMVGFQPTYTFRLESHPMEVYSYISHHCYNLALSTTIYSNIFNYAITRSELFRRLVCA